MKNKKVLVCFILAVMVVLTLFSGCSLVTVDPEKDSAQTLMTIGDEDTVTKSVFNNHMAYMEIQYAAAGSSMPTGKELDEMKSSLMKSIVQTKVLAAKGKADHLEVDEAEATKTGEEAYNETKNNAEKGYASALKKWNTNDESFKAYMIQNSIDDAYASAAQEAFKTKIKDDPKSYLGEVVGTVNEADVTRGEYHYYFIQAYLNYYMTNSAAMDTTDEKLLKETNTEIFKTIGKNHGLIKYCEENDIAISEETVQTQQASLESMLGNFFEDDAAISEFIDSFNLTLNQFKEYQKEEAKAAAAKAAIQEKMNKEVEITDAEIKSYYNKNKTSYDPSTVSACHILTEDKEFATEIYQSAKDCKTKEDFEAVMAEYKENENVTEATDLGAFTYGKMVKEFSKQAFSMGVNTLSKPTKTEFGYHIIYVYDKNEVKDQSWEDYKDTIKTSLQSEKGTKVYEKFETDLDKQQKPAFENLKIGLEAYVETLKTELNVTVYEKVI